MLTRTLPTHCGAILLQTIHAFYSAKYPPDYFVFEVMS